MTDKINGVTLYVDETGQRRSFPTALVDAVATALAAQQNEATTPKGYQQLKSDDLAVAQPLDVPADATRAVIQNNGAQAARYRNDGVDPTPATGARLNSGDEINVTGSLSSYSFIREAEGAALDVTYYG